MLSRNQYCPHSNADRTLRGTWCTPELVKVVEKGYTLVKIHEEIGCFNSNHMAALQG